MTWSSEHYTFVVQSFVEKMKSLSPLLNAFFQFATFVESSLGKMTVINKKHSLT